MIYAAAVSNLFTPVFFYAVCDFSNRLQNLAMVTLILYNHIYASAETSFQKCTIANMSLGYQNKVVTPLHSCSYRRNQKKCLQGLLGEDWIYRVSTWTLQFQSNEVCMHLPTSSTLKNSILKCFGLPWCRRIQICSEVLYTCIMKWPSFCSNCNINYRFQVHLPFVQYTYQYAICATRKI